MKFLERVASSVILFIVNLFSIDLEDRKRELTGDRYSSMQE
jgi:hypothetical protein